MKEAEIITLEKGGFTVVDADLFDWLNQWKWKVTDSGYVHRYQKISKGRYAKVYMHGLINGTPAGMKTDHINGHKLDNRRSNLRSATNTQNCQNCGKHQRGTPHSKFKGVWRVRNGKWVTQICANRTKRHIGTFSSETEAAKAYNQVASELHGSFARLNVISNVN